MKNSRPYVLFVCEHGSAKSVIAAAHFNRLSVEKGSAFHAISRGTDPDNEIPLNVVQGLKADGITPDDAKPLLLSNEDIAGAILVVTFCDLPESVRSKTPLVLWTDVPPVSEDYDIARDEISKRSNKLLTDLDPR